MSTSGEEPQDRPTPRPGNYGEIAPGVPRYGEYAPTGWEPPQEIKDAQQARAQLPAASTYPGFNGAQPGAAANHLAPPAKVLLASRLILAAGVMQAVSVVALLVVLLVPSIKASVMGVLQNNFAATPELVALYSDATLVNTALFLAFIISLILTGAYFWLARAVRRGAGWARTTSLVLAILSLLFLSQPNPLTIIQVLLGIVAVFLLYRATATEFFQRHKAHKSQKR